MVKTEKKVIEQSTVFCDFCGEKETTSNNIEKFSYGTVDGVTKYDIHTSCKDKIILTAIVAVQDKIN